MIMALKEEQIDDILFYARAGELEELRICIQELSQATSTAELDIIAASVEEQSQNTALHMAAANGQLGTLNYVLELISAQSKSSFLNAQNAWGNTPLHWAALNGHLEAVKALVVAGAIMSIKNKAGHDAAYEAEMYSRNSVVEWLLQKDKEFESRFEEPQESASTNGEMKAEAQSDETELLVKTKDVTLEPSLRPQNI